jgi:hypothetical protein
MNARAVAHCGGPTRLMSPASARGDAGSGRATRWRFRVHMNDMSTPSRTNHAWADRIVRKFSSDARFGVRVGSSAVV